MFGIGSSEFLVIIIVAIVVLGPEHLPRVMRTFNKVMSDFRQVSTDFQRTMNLEALADEEKRVKQRKKKKKKVTPQEEPSDAIVPEETQVEEVQETCVADQASCHETYVSTSTPPPSQPAQEAFDELAALVKGQEQRALDEASATDAAMANDPQASLEPSEQTLVKDSQND